MLKLLTPARRSLIAMDFGACSFRALQLQRSGDHWRIHHWVNVEREPEDASPPPPNHAREVELAFGPGTFSGTRFALLLSPPDVDFKLLEVPEAVLHRPAEELRDALQFELSRQVSWPVQETEIAAWPTQPAAPGKAGAPGGIVSAMVTVAPSAGVRQHLAFVEPLGLRCERADIVPLAIARLLSKNRGHSAGFNPPSDSQHSPSAMSPNAVWGLADIGFQAARLYLMHGDTPVYARTLHGSGRELTESLASTLHVHFRVAEQYKRTYGIERSDRGYRTALSGLSRISEEALPGILYSILRPVLDTFADEIERSYRFALGKLTGSAAGPLYLMGGGARLRGLTDVLSHRLGVPVQTPDPRPMFGSAQPDSPTHPACTAAAFPVLAGVAGLALMEEDA